MKATFSVVQHSYHLNAIVGFPVRALPQCRPDDSGTRMTCSHTTLYAYVRNNPLTLTDPSGFSWWVNMVNHRSTKIGLAIVTGGASLVVKATDKSLKEFGRFARKNKAGLNNPANFSGQVDSFTFKITGHDRRAYPSIGHHQIAMLRFLSRPSVALYRPNWLSNAKQMLNPRSDFICADCRSPLRSAVCNGCLFVG